MENEELRTRLELQCSQEREEELERLRIELVVATETARKLFGVMDQNATDKTDQTISDSLLEMRLRIVQLDRQLESVERQLQRSKAAIIELENTIEQRDLVNARLNSENQRLREVILFQKI